MTSNIIAVTEGSGKNVATETIGTTDYQQIKIIDGKVGSTSILSFVNNGTAIPVSIMGTATVALSGGTSSIVGTVTVSSIAGAVTPYAQPDSLVQNTTSIITGITAVSVLSAPGASLRNYITQITVTNGSATATYITIKDSGSSVMHGGYAAASGGGYTTSFPTPLRQWTLNASVDIVSSAQGSVVAAISGYKAA